MSRFHDAAGTPALWVPLHLYLLTWWGCVLSCCTMSYSCVSTHFGPGYVSLEAGWGSRRELQSGEGWVDPSASAVYAESISGVHASNWIISVHFWESCDLEQAALRVPRWCNWMACILAAARVLAFHRHACRPLQRIHHHGSISKCIRIGITCAAADNIRPAGEINTFSIQLVDNHGNNVTKFYDQGLQVSMKKNHTDLYQQKRWIQTGLKDPSIASRKENRSDMHV